MTTGEKIKNVRQRAGYTQEQLAEKLLVSRQAIAKWESDRGVPDIENLQAIAKHFDLSVDDLLNPEVEIGGAVPSEFPTAPEVVPAVASGISSPTDTAGQKHPVRKKGLIPIIAGASALVLLIVLFVTAILPNIRYNMNQNRLLEEAEALKAKGDYAAAADMFERVGRPEAKEEARFCRYTYANELYEKREYEAAIEEIGKLETYKDAAELYDSWRYEYALWLTKQGIYDEAISRFESLGDYKKAKDNANELSYFYGCQLFNKGNYERAVFYFSQSGDRHLWVEAKYNYAVQLYNEGKYGLSYNAFNELIKSGEPARVNSETVAKETLQTLLLTGMAWTKTETYNSGSTKAAITMAITSGQTQIALNDTVSGQHIGTLTYTTSFLEPSGNTMKEIYVGGITSEGEPIVFTFSFINNTRVQIHYNHFVDGRCDEIVCGTYEAINAAATEAMQATLLNKTLSYSIHKIVPIELSFLDELPSDDTTVKDETDGSTSATAATSGNTPSSSGKQTTQSSAITQKTSASVPHATTTTKKTTTKTTTQKTTKKTTVSTTTGRSKTTTTTHPCADGHTWKEATYTAPKTCTVCGETSGEPLSKPWETRNVEGGVEIIGIGTFEASGDYNIPAEIDGKTVVGIGAGAFSYDDTIKNITIPNTVTYIEESAFSNISGLTTIRIPSSVKRIGTNAFIKCSYLSSVYISSLDVEMGNHVFSNMYQRKCDLTIYAPAALSNKLRGYDAKIVEWNE